MRRTLFICAALFGGMCAAAGAETLTAVLEPKTSASMTATRAGRISDIHVNEGDRVTARQPLVDMESAVQSARVSLAIVAAQANGVVKRADQQIAQAQKLLTRETTARTRGAAQPREVEQAEQALALAKADRRIAQEALERAGAQLVLEKAILEELTLRAPFDGLILEIVHSTGETVDSDIPILTLADLSVLKATGFVSSQGASGLATGTTLQARLDGAAAPVDVTVSSIDPRIDSVSQTQRVTFELDNAALAYRPGATLVLDLP